MFSKNVNILTLKQSEYPENLNCITPLPDKLFYSGMPLSSWINKPKVAIVGSRRMSTYGKEVTSRLSSALARNGVVIISGLAYGVDVTAHKVTLEARGITVAVLPASLNKIYPAAHYQIALQIIDSGGSLISEYDEGAEVFKENFIARNRIVSGLADILVITEAAVSSGSLHTARFALEQGKSVMAVPGNINSPLSGGANNLIKAGAEPILSVDDILVNLKIDVKKNKTRRAVYRGTESEEKILKLIASGVGNQEELVSLSELSSPELNSALTSLEIAGTIRPAGNGNWYAT